MAEKEYIEKGELLKTFREGYELPIAPGVATAYWTRVVQIKDALIEFVEKTTPADVAPVVHAEWKCVSDDDQYEGEYYCSACSAEEYIPDNAIFPPFCWHCGAKMDGGVNHGNV